MLWRRLLNAMKH